jgi:hypothetical protein
LPNIKKQDLNPKKLMISIFRKISKLNKENKKEVFIKRLRKPKQTKRTKKKHTNTKCYQRGYKTSDVKKVKNKNRRN